MRPYTKCKECDAEGGHILFYKKRLTWYEFSLYSVYKDIYSNHTWNGEGDIQHEFESKEASLVDDEAGIGARLASMDLDSVVHSVCGNYVRRLHA